jgi:hypothetical protein
MIPPIRPEVKPPWVGGQPTKARHWLSRAERRPTTLTSNYIRAMAVRVSSAYQRGEKQRSGSAGQSMGWRFFAGPKLRHTENLGATHLQNCRRNRDFASVPRLY